MIEKIPVRSISLDEQLSIVNDFEANLDHDQYDDHPFQSNVMFVAQMVWQELDEF